MAVNPHSCESEPQFTIGINLNDMNNVWKKSNRPTNYLKHGQTMAFYRSWFLCISIPYQEKKAN